MDFTYAKKWYLVTGASTQGTDPQKKLTSITLDEALSSSVIQNNAPLTLVLSGAVHNYSHVEGQSNISGSPAQHVGGKFNVVTYGAEVIGGGTSNTERANIRTLDWSGNEMLAGKLTVGAGPTNNMDVATKQYVDSKEVPPEIFWITVNTSTLAADKTFAEIAAAVGDNKLPIVLADGNSIYLFLYLGTTYMRFTRYIGASGKSLRCNSDDTWEIDYNANLQEQITASGLLKGNGSGGISAAVAGTDYQAPISNNVTGSGTSGYIAKFNGANTITNGPVIGTSTTTYLRNDGSWATPAGTYSLPTAAAGTKGGIKVGSGLTMSSETLNHESSITAGTVGTSSATSGSTLAVPYVTYNATGHITATGTHTHTVSGFAASTHNHAAGDINSGTLGVARGGTGAASFTANCVVMSGSSTTAALTTRAVTNNTSATALAANTNIPTQNTVYYGLNHRLNRTTAVNAADTGYTTIMARGMGLRNADTNPSLNGAINWTYE